MSMAHVIEVRICGWAYLQTTPILYSHNLITPTQAQMTVIPSKILTVKEMLYEKNIQSLL